MPLFDRFRQLFKAENDGGATKRQASRVAKYINKTHSPVDDWLIVGDLGDGAFGKVQKAQLRDRKDVFAAAKCIVIEEDEEVCDYLVEIEILSECKHKNIVQLYDVYFHNQHLWMLLEFCACGAIDSIMFELEKPLTEPQIQFVCHEVVEALRFLHTCNVIHRDLKAGNILLTADGAVKLADFGVSAKSADATVKRDTFIGTPYWMAPEVMMCETFKDNPYDRQADIWSLGITLIELAQMEPPNHQFNPMRVLIKIQKSEPPTLEQPAKWSAAFHDFLRRCLIKTPYKRWSATDLLSHEFISSATDRKPLLALLSEVKAEVVSEEIIDEPMDEERMSHMSSESDAPVGSSTPEPHTLQLNGDSAPVVEPAKSVIPPSVQPLTVAVGRTSPTHTDDVSLSPTSDSDESSRPSPLPTTIEEEVEPSVLHSHTLAVSPSTSTAAEPLTEAPPPQPATTQTPTVAAAARDSRSSSDESRRSRRQAPPVPAILDQADVILDDLYDSLTTEERSRTPDAQPQQQQQQFESPTAGLMLEEMLDVVHRNGQVAAAATPETPTAADQVRPSSPAVCESRRRTPPPVKAKPSSRGRVPVNNMKDYFEAEQKRVTESPSPTPFVAQPKPNQLREQWERKSNTSSDGHSSSAQDSSTSSHRQLDIPVGLVSEKRASVLHQQQQQATEKRRSLENGQLNRQTTPEPIVGGSESAGRRRGHQVASVLKDRAAVLENVLTNAELASNQSMIPAQQRQSTPPALPSKAPAPPPPRPPRQYAADAPTLDRPVQTRSKPQQQQQQQQPTTSSTEQQQAAHKARMRQVPVPVPPSQPPARQRLSQSPKPNGTVPGYDEQRNRQSQQPPRLQQQIRERVARQSNEDASVRKPAAPPEPPVDYTDTMPSRQMHAAADTGGSRSSRTSEQSTSQGTSHDSPEQKPVPREVKQLKSEPESATSLGTRKSPYRRTVTKKTRVFTVDGVQHQSTTFHVMGEDGQLYKAREDFQSRKAEMHELKRLQRDEARQRQDLDAQGEMIREQQEKKFAMEKSNLERSYDNDLAELMKEQKRKIENTEREQEEELRQASKRLRNEQEKDLKVFREHLRQDMKLLKHETDCLPKHQRKEALKHLKEKKESEHAQREVEYMESLTRAHDQTMRRMQDAHIQKVSLLERQFLQQKHHLLRSREAAMWELEERQLSDRHMLYKQQLKDMFYLQRTLMLDRDHKELEHIRKMHAREVDELNRAMAADMKRLPKILRADSKTRTLMFKDKLYALHKESLRISGPTDASTIQDKIRLFEEAEKRRIKQALQHQDAKAKRRLNHLIQRHEQTVRELEQIQNEKRKMLIDHEALKLSEYDEEYTNVLKEWRAQLKPRKQQLEAKFGEELSEQEKFYNVQRNGGEAGQQQYAGSALLHS